MEKIETFYEEYEDMFEEYLENVKRDLRNNNEEYIKLCKEFHNILDEKSLCAVRGSTGAVASNP